jgi:hypothetical protein
MRHLAYNVRYSVVPINSLLLTIILHSSVRTTLVYKDTKYSAPFMALQPSSDCIHRVSMGIYRGYFSLTGTTRNRQYNITSYFTEIGWESAERINPSQDRNKWLAVTRTVRSLGVQKVGTNG